MAENFGGVGRLNVGKYQLLYQYLRDRFADRVVLTFGEIEDLLGFPLPDAARIEGEWWLDGDGTADRSVQSSAWTMAHRTAKANLRAHNVMFERMSA